MNVHVAILFERYIKMILAGRKSVESRLTKTRRAPFERIEPGETIYFKASRGSYMAKAVAEKVEFHRDLTPQKVDELRRRHQTAVGGEDAYWQAKQTSRYATFIQLGQIQPTREGPAMGPSQGLAWFMFPDRSGTGDFTVPLSAGAIRNHYVALPGKQRSLAIQGGSEEDRAGGALRLVLPDGKVVNTQLLPQRGALRWRGWGPYFEKAGLRAGDLICFERLEAGRYRITFEPRVSRAESRPCVRTEPSMPAQSKRPDAQPALKDYITARNLEALIRRAREEDMGRAGVDLTSELLIPEGLKAVARFMARQSGRLAGAAMLPAIARIYDPSLQIQADATDGQALDAGAVVARVSGPLRSILAMERVALNFLTHLGGVASLAAAYVLAVAGTKAGIYDTRKTLPGLRALEKYAVMCGGARNHRVGLYDAVLVKDNHIAHLELEDLPAALAQAMAQARARAGRPTFFEVEVDRLEQLERVLPLGPDIVLLDNMSLADLGQAVALRDRMAPGVQLEASGGVNLQSVGAIARTGVDRISVGAITHSAPALDIALDIEPVHG